MWDVGEGAEDGHLKPPAQRSTLCWGGGGGAGVEGGVGLGLGVGVEAIGTSPARGGQKPHVAGLTDVP